MAKAKNSFEVLARDAATRIDQARVMGEQLTFLGDEAGAPVVDTVDRKSGRPVGAKNKGSSELRKWLASEGYRMPEDMLAQMAGLNSRDPAIVVAMQQTEQVLTWAFADAKEQGGAWDGKPILPTPAQKLQMFNTLYTILLRAADALLPYIAAKASTDGPAQLAVQINVPLMPSQPADAGANATVINGSKAGRMMPANVRWKMQQDQQVSESAVKNSDAESRTE